MANIRAVPVNNGAAPVAYTSASLYVGDLDHQVTEAALYEIFNQCGAVASVRVCRDTATRRSLGYAYVNFHLAENAERALDTMNHKKINGRPCRIMWSHRDPSLRNSGLGNIFVKNLSKTIDNKQLNDTFSIFGNILSCKVAVDNKGKSLGYGFVHYDSENAAKMAIEKSNGKGILGRVVGVFPFKAKEERGANRFKFTNVFVRNISVDATDEEIDQLWAEFGKAGEITSAVVARDNEQKIRGFGYVNYATPEEAEKAVELLNEFEFKGKQLFVCRHQKRSERNKELREKFDALKAERRKKYEGVNLYIKNLADTVDEPKLRAEFEKFGAIVSARVMVDQATKKSKGFGFVCFSTQEEATKAVTEMNGRMLDGKPLYVALAQSKEARRQQLQAQYAKRMMPHQMGMHGPMYYQQQRPPHPQQMMYPMGGRPGFRGQPPMHMQRGQPVNWQLVPAQQQQQQQPQQGQPQGRQHPHQGRQQQQPHMNGQPNRPNQKPRQQQQQQQQPKAAPAPVPAQAQPAQAPAQSVLPTAPNAEQLTVKALAALPEAAKKQKIGECLFPRIQVYQPELAGKITGMLLEMDNTELILLLETEEDLAAKVKEAMEVLNSAESAQ